MGDFTLNNAAATVLVVTGTFNVADMLISNDSFTQTGNNTGTQKLSSLTVSGGSCTWDAGDLTLNGTFSHTNGSMDFGTKTVTGVTTFTVTNPDGDCDLGGATITASGNVTISTTGAGNLIPGTSLLIMNGGNLSSDSALNNLRINAACILQSDITLNGWLEITGTGSLDANAAGPYDITLAGDWTNSGTFTHRGNMVTFNGTTDQDFTPGVCTYSAITVTNDLSTTTGGLTANAAANNITVGRNCNRSGGAFTPSGNTVIFNNAGAFQNAENFYNLTVSAGGRRRCDNTQ